MFLFESELELLRHKNGLLNGYVGIGLASLEEKMNFLWNFKVLSQEHKFFNLLEMPEFRGMLEWNEISWHVDLYYALLDREVPKHEECHLLIDLLELDRIKVSFLSHM
ncbi:unnamed protein product [Prunus armeniaca]